MRTNGIIQLAPAVRILVFLIIGIWTGSCIAGRIPLWIWTAAIATLAALAVIIRKKPIAASITIIVLTTVAGGYTYKVYDMSTQANLPDGYVVCKSIVSSRITEKGKVVGCDMTITSVNGILLEKPLKVRATIAKDTIYGRWRDISVGDGIEHYSRLKRPENHAVSSNFNYRQWMKCHGYVSQTFVPYDCWHFENVATSNIPTWQLTAISLQRIADRFIKKHILPQKATGDSFESGMATISAMTLGDKTQLTKDINDSFSIAGASHILALSGLHLGIIFSLLSLLAGKNRQRNALFQAITAAIIWTYVLMAGMPVSIIRAATMITLYSIVGLICSRKMSLNIFAFTLCTMLFINPLSIWDISFQMSALAVASILVINGSIHRLFNPKTKMARIIWTSIAVSISAQIGTAPIVAYYFGRFSCYFFIVNIIVIPFATIIIAGSITAFILTIISPSFAISFYLLAKVAYIMNKFIIWVSNLPYASIENINVSDRHVLAYYLLLTVLIFAINRKKFRS